MKPFSEGGCLLGGSSHLVSVVINHGDRKSPKDRFVPLQMAFLWLINGGDPHHLQVPAMILQVGQLMTQTNNVTGPERELTRKNLIRQGLANWKRPQKI